MNDTAPQTADGKVLMHFTMSLDGFVAGPNHKMDWTMGDFSNRPGLLDEYVEVFSPTIGRQLLQLGLIDEIDLHIAPILLGDGIRLYDNPASEPVLLKRSSDGTMSEVKVRYRPARPARTR